MSHGPGSRLYPSPTPEPRITSTEVKANRGGKNPEWGRRGFVWVQGFCADSMGDYPWRKEPPASYNAVDFVLGGLTPKLKRVTLESCQHRLGVA